MSSKETVRTYWRFVVVSLALLVGVTILSQRVFASNSPTLLDPPNVPVTHSNGGFDNGLMHAIDGDTSPKQEPMQEQEQSRQPGQPATPLERVLNKDGTLDLSTGFSGSIDPKGWRMETSPNGEPRFVKSDDQQQQQQPPPAEPRSTTSTPSSLSPLAPGDENWDPRFNLPGVNNYVYAIAISGSDVYVGGRFTTAGGVAANSIARWDGSNWSALGSGVDVQVEALAVSGSDVYAGGLFFSAGGVAANNIAKWDGSSWSPLGSGVGNGTCCSHVYAIAISGSDVYVGGRFTRAGGLPAN